MRVRPMFSKTKAKGLLNAASSSRLDYLMFKSSLSHFIENRVHLCSSRLSRHANEPTWADQLLGWTLCISSRSNRHFDFRSLSLFFRTSTSSALYLQCYGPGELLTPKLARGLAPPHSKPHSMESSFSGRSSAQLWNTTPNAIKRCSARITGLRLRYRNFNMHLYTRRQFISIRRDFVGLTNHESVAKLFLRT